MDRDHTPVSLDVVLAKMHALGIRMGRPTVIGDNSTFFGQMMGRAVDGILTVEEWQCIEFGLRSVKEGRAHVVTDLGSQFLGSLYDQLRPEFPFLKGSPPLGHPYPGAYHDPPAARQQRKGKKGRGRA
jgi:hypothetical protein